MKVYFVRHGQSTQNLNAFETTIHQADDIPLSEKGYEQARVLAGRFTHLPVDLILSSSHTRALQTAEEIQKKTRAHLIQSELLIERAMPSSFQGKSVNDPEIVPIHEMIRAHFDEPEWHYAEEENFHDLIKRAKKVLEYLIAQKLENVVVVTHGYFLVLLLNYILLGDLLTVPLFRSFIKHSVYSNTGLTLCEYNKNEWKILTLNDYAHLGE